MSAQPTRDWGSMVDLPRKPYGKPAMGGENRPVCGRKFCSMCGRWRLLTDFDVHTRSTRGTPVYWQARCRVCHRTVARELAGHQPRRKRMTAEETRERARARQKAQRQDPQWLEQRREYERIYKERRRRKDGAQPRKIGPRSKKYSDKFNPRDVVPNAPFREAIERRGLSTRDVARNLGWMNSGRPDDLRVRRLLGLVGVVSDRPQESMSYRNAVKVARAIGLDPVEMDV